MSILNDSSPRMSPLAYAWAFPTTMFGLVVAILTGSLRMSCVAGVVEVDAPRATWLLHQVLRIIAWVTRSSAIFPAAFTLGHMIFAVDVKAASYWRLHERVHVRQNERWGPAWLPVYLLASAWAQVRGKNPYYDNFFEIEASPGWDGRYSIPTGRSRDRTGY